MENLNWNAAGISINIVQPSFNSSSQQSCLEPIKEWNIHLPHPNMLCRVDRSNVILNTIHKLMKQLEHYSCVLNKQFENDYGANPVSSKGSQRTNEAGMKIKYRQMVCLNHESNVQNTSVVEENDSDDDVQALFSPIKNNEGQNKRRCGEPSNKHDISFLRSPDSSNLKKSSSALSLNVNGIRSQRSRVVQNEINENLNTGVTIGNFREYNISQAATESKINYNPDSPFLSQRSRVVQNEINENLNTSVSIGNFREYNISQAATESKINYSPDSPLLSQRSSVTQNEINENLNGSLTIRNLTAHNISDTESEIEYSEDTPFSSEDIVPPDRWLSVATVQRNEPDSDEELRAEENRVLKMHRQLASLTKPRNVYTLDEKEKIIRYIVDKRAYDRVKGVALWKEMAQDRVCNRSWHSLKEHFRKQILPNITRFRFLSKTQIKRFNRNNERLDNSKTDAGSTRGLLH